jgi:hypothetical protein
MVNETIKQLKNAIRHRYAFPGGYELSAITQDGAALCMECCKENFRNIVDSTKKQIGDGWQVAGIDILWEGIHNCDQCNKDLSVYGDPDQA